MFDFLKKKITGLVEKITGKAEEKAEAPEPVKREEPKAAPRKEGILKAQPREEKKAEKLAPIGAKAKEAAPEGRGAREVVKEVELATKQKAEPIPAAKAETAKPQRFEKVEKAEAVAKAAEPAPKPPERKVERVPERAEPKKEDKVKLSFLTQVKSIFSGEVELGEKDICSALDDFEMELLEGDVALEVAEQIKSELRGQLVGRKVKKSELHAQIASIFFNSIRDIMAENTGRPIVEQVRALEARPVKIMFTGPNGSGKTTTIAKIANMLKGEGFGVVIAAADTFRAAAIEQMEIHGERLGVKVIKGRYGADPTSVAFDAVNHAKAHGLDVVLIDTAGRQETNLNLLSELKKMVRVIKPEIKLYIGESIAGNAVIGQVDAFNKELGLDGVILTKLDCDAKGGTIISISKVTKVPVLYVTVGQGYGDIEEFDPDRIAGNIAG